MNKIIMKEWRNMIIDKTLVITVMLCVASCAIEVDKDKDNKIYQCVQKNASDQLLVVNSFVLKHGVAGNRDEYVSLAREIDTFAIDEYSKIQPGDFWESYRPEIILKCINDQGGKETKYYLLLRKMILYPSQINKADGDTTLEDFVKSAKLEYFDSQLYLFCLNYCLYYTFQYKRIDQSVRRITR